MKLIAVLLAVSLSFAMVACNDDDDGASDATATPEISDGLPTTELSPEESATPDDEPATPVSEGSTDSFMFPASPDPATEPALLTDVRVGAHPEDGFDRIVFEFEEGQRPSGVVAYKDEVAECGSGMPVDPEGSHILTAHFDFTNAHTEAGELSIPSTTVSGPGNSILEAVSTCDFEAVVEWAIGVEGEQPFTVTLLENPNRVVIDVAH